MRFAKEEEEKIRNVRSRAHGNAAGYGWSPGVLTHHATNFDSCPLLLMGHDISIIEKNRHRMLPDLGVQSIPGGAGAVGGEIFGRQGAQGARREALATAGAKEAPGGVSEPSRCRLRLEGVCCFA